MPTADEIREKLKGVRYPGFSRDIVSFGLVKEIACEKGRVTLDMAVATSDEAVIGQIQEASAAAVRTLPGVVSVAINIARPAGGGTASAPAGQGAARSELEGVRHVVAVASGKGGVGKSTVAANLACAFHRLGMATGLCDCDIYGPSMGLMFGTVENPEVDGEQRILPVRRHGLSLMSMGFLLDPESPAILRGPMVTRYTQQFLRGVLWGKLDMLVLDLPPGTGDIQLTIVQTVALSGAVIVTTPQEVALIDARKAAAMFSRVSVPILGLIENMSHFVCPSDGKRYDIFGKGGGKREAERLGIPLLAEVPLDIPTREAGDEGTPILVRDPGNPVSKAFESAAKQIAGALG